MFTTEAVTALLLSLGAGLATMLGAIPVFGASRKNNRLLAVSLGFAAGVMIAVSFSELLPAAAAALDESVGKRWSVVLGVLFLALGMLLAAGLDFFIPHKEFDEKEGGKEHKDLFRVGFVSTLAIGLHNFPEGMATFMAGYENLGLGVSVAIAIAMHNIPEGISVAMPIYFATGSRRKALKYTFLSGVSEPIGAFLAFLVLRPFLSPFLLGAMMALVSGIMFYIAVEELLPSSRQYGHNRAALISVLAGICVMPLANLF